MRRLIAIGLVALLMAGCNCSMNPKYRCSPVGIIEMQKAWEAGWEPVSGSAIVRCEPGRPISPDNFK